MGSGRQCRDFVPLRQPVPLPLAPLRGADLIQALRRVAEPGAPASPPRLPRQPDLPALPVHPEAKVEFLQRAPVIRYFDFIEVIRTNRRDRTSQKLIPVE